jgi:3'-5' exoribonuclease
MFSLQNVYHQPPGPICGTFRLTDVCYHETRTGQPYMRLQLEDMSAHISAYAWREDIYRHLYLPNYSLIHVQGHSRYFDQQLRIDLNGMTPLGFKPSGDVVRLIPQSLCPYPGLLLQLQGLMNRLTIPSLREFVEAVLADDSLAFAFVSVPASLNHHHNYPGGLLSHSLECVSLVERHHEFPIHSYQLGLVAALFHDIGKILTLTAQMERTSLGESLDHDKLTLEILGPYLKRLEESWPQGATKLRYLLTWKLRKPVPRYNVADLIACSDRISSGLDMQRRA